MNNEHNDTCTTCTEGKTCMKCCQCIHHSITPILMILFATTFLLGYLKYFDMQTVNTIWPILVGIAGIAKLGDHKCKCC